jgi:hypothetical protein
MPSGTETAKHIAAAQPQSLYPPACASKKRHGLRELCGASFVAAMQDDDAELAIDAGGEEVESTPDIKAQAIWTVDAGAAGDV